MRINLQTIYNKVKQNCGDKPTKTLIKQEFLTAIKEIAEKFLKNKK